MQNNLTVGNISFGNSNIGGYDFSPYLDFDVGCKFEKKTVRFDDNTLRRIGDWLLTKDAGLSSKTMLGIALGSTSGSFYPPMDPSDFGRCYRLVKQVPEIKEIFSKISRLVPQFSTMLLYWEAFCGKYEDCLSGKVTWEEFHNMITDSHMGIYQ